MKKNLLSIAFLFFLSLNFTAAYCQSNNKQILLNMKNDTASVNRLNETIAEILASSNDTAKLYAETALDISKKINYSNGIIISLRNLGACNTINNNYQLALENYKDALNAAQRSNNVLLQVSILDELGALYKKLSNWEDAMRCYLDALKIKEQRGDKEGVANSYFSLGDLYWYMKKYDVAMEYYNKGYSVAKATNSYLLMGKGLGSIGRTYYYKRDYKTAIGYLLQAKTLLEQTTNKKQTANNYNNIGLAYVRLKQYDEAKIYHTKALLIRKEINDKEGILISLANIGEMNYYSGNKSEALKLYKEAEKLAVEHKMGFALKTIYGSILNIYKDFSDFKSAYLYHEKYIALDDSIYNADTFKKIKELNTKYEVEKKDLELKNNRIIIYASIIVIVVVSAFLILLYVLYSNKKKLNKKLVEQNLEIEAKKTEILNHKDELEILNKELKQQKEFIAGQRDEIEAELKETLIKSEVLQKENILFQFEALKNQVNPHFLFNNFSTLINLIPENPKLAENYVHNLSNVYRYILTTSTSKLQELRYELEFVKSYLFLVEIRFDNNINLIVNIEEEYYGYFIPLLSLQLLIENAIKHNVVSAKKKLNISIINEGDVLVVKNNIQKKCSVEESTKVGLQNIIKRYSLITDRKVEIINTEAEFIVRIPLIKNSGVI